MSYTTATKVRENAGFTGNANISDAIIVSRIVRAEGMINSKLKNVYALPLPKYHFNVITFSGTGSGAGTLTMVIGGVSVAVTIASGLTAAQAADRFRTAALDNAAFALDSLGDGAAVTIHGISGDDSSEVTVTSTDPQTVAGITATGATVTETAPPIIEMIATEIAAALMLIKEYGDEAQDADKDGFKRLTLAKKDLQALADQEDGILDFAAVELPKVTAKRLGFYPTDASETDADHPTAARLRIDRKY